MSRDYHFDRDAYNPYEQDYDSGFSSQNREYKDLYNPNKSTWERALKERSQKFSERGRHNYTGTEAPRSYGQEKNPETKQGYYKMPSLSGNQNKVKPDVSDETIYDSGYDITKKNTYNHLTTGYGPRD